MSSYTQDKKEFLNLVQKVKEIDPSAAKWMLENVEEDMKYGTLDGCFIWKDSPQKARFWANIQNLICAPKVTKENVLKYQADFRPLVFIHIKERNADGTPVRCRQLGKIQTWKTRPEEFKIPVKYGLKSSFYITNENAHEWRIV